MHKGPAAQVITPYAKEMRLLELMEPYYDPKANPVYYEYDYDGVRDYLKEAEFNGKKITWIINNGNHLLLRFAKNRRMLSLLIEYGAPIKLADRTGRTALHHAVLEETLNPYLIQALLDF